ncbi:hypothetical protein PG996_004501 [Apiospora saccharicola]|uniref:Uncharacterized protein n=1 Tax=Apiospora saccharicola TaxID=335842 RepID=A0ABR1W4A8_9PEZI
MLMAKRPHGGVLLRAVRTWFKASHHWRNHNTPAASVFSTTATSRLHAWPVITELQRRGWRQVPKSSLSAAAADGDTPTPLYTRLLDSVTQPPELPKDLNKNYRDQSGNQRHGDRWWIHFFDNKVRLKRPWLDVARRRLVQYHRSLGTHRPDGTKHSIGKAKAALAADEAGPRFCRWLSQTTVQDLLENRLYHEQQARDVLSLAIEAIVGAGQWYKLAWWLNSTTSIDTMGGDAFLKMLQLRCFLFTSILQAIHRWDPEAATTDAHDFLTKFGGETLRRHIDIAPLIIRALEEECRRKPAVHGSAGDLKGFLGASKRELLDSRGALELQLAVLALSQPSQPSPTEFKRLLIELISNDGHPLRTEYQESRVISKRVRRLAERCSELLKAMGSHEEATEVLDMARELYIGDISSSTETSSTKAPSDKVPSTKSSKTPSRKSSSTKKSSTKYWSVKDSTTQASPTETTPKAVSSVQEVGIGSSVPLREVVTRVYN